MTTEERDLLLRDLSARVPYGVKCELLHCGIRHAARITRLHNFGVKAIIPGTSITKEIPITDVKLFLFPSSSMTEEQKNSLEKIAEWGHMANDCSLLCDKTYFAFDKLIGGFSIETCSNIIDFLNANYFDYRGLIERGLAIDATGLNIY